MAIKKPYISVIGAANIDIISTAFCSNTQKDSMPGTIHYSYGGVARNIAENLVCLGLPVVFITAVGEDYFGRAIISDAQKKGIDTSHFLSVKNKNTSSYNAFLDNNNDLLYAVSDMQIVKELTPHYIEQKRAIIQNSNICVLDANLSANTLKSIVTKIKGPRYILDTVSGIKAKKAKNILKHFFLIKTNQLELNFLLDTNTATATLEDLGAQALTKGLNNLVVSLGAKGVWYIQSTKNTSVKGKCSTLKESGAFVQKKKHVIKNATGAGDAMCAGIVFALYKQKDLKTAIRYGIAASLITVQDSQSVAKKMSSLKLNQTIKQVSDQAVNQILDQTLD